MLFDLRGRGRRRTIQGLYLFLALLMGGGLVFLGVGGGGLGILNATNDQGGGGGGDPFKGRVKAAETRVRQAPRNPAAWVALARLQYLEAGNHVDRGTSAYTRDGLVLLAQAGAAWQRYLALNPAHPDPDVAVLIARAYAPEALNQPARAADAQEIAAAAHPSVATFEDLARYSWSAGQTRRGDLAAARVLALVPKAARAGVKSALDQAKAAATAGSGGHGSGAGTGTPGG